MTQDRKPATTRPDSPGTPWTDLDEAGSGLTVDNFLTTMLSQLVTALRHSVTLPYAEQFSLTVPEWRLLALLAHTGPISFSELVRLSTSDKALVSRALRMLEGRELVTLEAEGNTPRKKLNCTITQQGLDLHARIMPIARREQAAVLRLLEPAEREALYLALRKLHSRCVVGEDEGAGKALLPGEQ
ncbi:MarR family winged helix-turn-helix transcriptional regulator [Cupriavidus respiraculi]|uniref:HTH marR-type domain-containing protein n=1 Tax=Cupriavidus respiraculi TaxID=195930 RepID=A0ABN7YB25_9BURK|nr:MarR family transcriptional regulator [Cupriavidus respiraculi]CAG9169032.1 hypothetical protein LMG21510_01319 [Cupriavidus respiraculi]